MGWTTFKMPAPGIGWGHGPTGFHAKSLANQVVDGAERSCERRAPGERKLVVGGPRHGALRGWMIEVWTKNMLQHLVFMTNRGTFFLKQHKNEMQEGVFLFFNATIDINRFFFGSIWRGCLNLPAFQRRCWATGLHRSWIMPWPRLSRSFARENARWSRKFQSPLGTKIYFGFGISQQNSDGLISLQGDVGPDWFLLGKRWSTSNHLLPFPKKKLNLMEWYETFGA